jgi:hypothetical protein
MIRILIAALALAASATAAAHTFWLEPAKHNPDPGEEMTVAFRVGDAGEVNAWALHWDRVASLRLYGPDGVIDQLAALRPTGPDEQGRALISVPSAGSYVLGFESNPSFSDLAAEPFNAYVAHEGLSAIAAHRQATGTMMANGTELYARRAKALLQVGDQQTGNVTRPIGQLLEIVPLANPFALAPGDKLTVQLLWRGAALEGASLMVARPDAKGEPLVIKTDAQGEASFELQNGSRYLIYTVWGVPTTFDTRADYLTIFSSLTFPSP